MAKTNKDFPWYKIPLGKKENGDTHYVKLINDENRYDYFPNTFVYSMYMGALDDHCESILSHLTKFKDANICLFDTCKNLENKFSKKLSKYASEPKDLPKLINDSWDTIMNIDLGKKDNKPLFLIINGYKLALQCLEYQFIKEGQKNKDNDDPWGETSGEIKYRNVENDCERKLRTILSLSENENSNVHVIVLDNYLGPDLYPRSIQTHLFGNVEVIGWIDDAGKRAIFDGDDIITEIDTALGGHHGKFEYYTPF